LTERTVYARTYLSRRRCAAWREGTRWHAMSAEGMHASGGAATADAVAGNEAVTASLVSLQAAAL